MQIIGKGITVITDSSDVGDIIFGRYAYILFINNMSRDLVRISIRRSFSAVLKNTKRLSYKSTPLNPERLRSRRRVVQLHSFRNPPSCSDAKLLSSVILQIPLPPRLSLTWSYMPN